MNYPQNIRLASYDGLTVFTSNVWLRELKQGLCNNIDWGGWWWWRWGGGEIGRKMGERLKGEGIYVYLWLIHVDVWQKPTKFCKAVILQLKNNNRKKTHWTVKKKKKSFPLKFLCWSPECDALVWEYKDVSFGTCLGQDPCSYKRRLRALLPFCHGRTQPESTSHESGNDVTRYQICQDLDLASQPS